VHAVVDIYALVCMVQYLTVLRLSKLSVFVLFTAHLLSSFTAVLSCAAAVTRHLLSHQHSVAGVVDVLARLEVCCCKHSPSTAAAMTPHKADDNSIVSLFAALYVVCAAMDACCRSSHVGRTLVAGSTTGSHCRTLNCCSELVDIAHTQYLSSACAQCQ
jgi:hypothetical protein